VEVVGSIPAEAYERIAAIVLRIQFPWKARPGGGAAIVQWTYGGGTNQQWLISITP
jgi:hypothetical protein